MDARTPSRERRDQQEHPESSKKDARGILSTMRRHPWLVAAIVIVLIALAVGTLIWWLHARQFESTDDAFIDTRVVSIATQVSGAVVEVDVTDNSDVDANTVLLRIDDRDYRAALDQARARIAQSEASIANYAAQIDAQQARIEQAQKEVAQAQSALTFAQQENERYQELLKTGTGTQQRAQQASSDLRQRQAAFDAAQAAAIASEKQIAVLRTQRDSAAAQLEEAQAARDQAQANLDRTVVRAPVAGRVSKLTAAQGGYAQTGQALMMFVPRDIWVTANFKETQLTLIRPGQPADIAIDAYPDRSFHAHVDSIQAGSGAAFALLPPENATGNYVKVVQRVPVKIVFDQNPDVPLGPGMSVVPTVKVR
jgi:membrane fusion protein (multidrug efflux system)